MSVCLVTGSSRGFGRLICERLAENGHRVYASMRDLDGHGADLARTCSLLQLDVTDDVAVVSGARLVFEREGRIDGVVTTPASCFGARWKRRPSRPSGVSST